MVEKVSKESQDIEQLETNMDFHGEALDNIFETYRTLRGKCPVGHSEKYGGYWFFLKNEDIFAAEQDPDRYSVAPSMLFPPIGTDEPMIPIDIDPPKHTSYRRILLPAFTPKAIDKLEPGMREIARNLAHKFLEAKDKDVARLFARPMPTIVFSRFAGFPEEDWEKFDVWIDEIFYGREDNPDRAYAAGAEVKKYFDELLTKRRKEPRKNDVISILLDAKVDGEPLSHNELINYCYLLFAGGLDTTAWAIRASLWHLGQHLEDQRKLRENPEAVFTAAEEFLRTMAPVQGMARTCKADVMVRGKKLSAGDRVVLMFGSGNRDPDVYDNPDEVQIDRENNTHLAFGAGHHRCLGSNLGRRELVVALQEFLDIVPEFTLADPSEVWHGVHRLTLNVKQ